jgi:hypothetical protein
MSGYKFNVGEVVDYFGRQRASSGAYTVTARLPSEDEELRYRVRNVNEPHERIAKESELRSMLPPQASF